MLSNKNIAILGYGELGKQFEILLEKEVDCPFTHYFDDVESENNANNASLFSDYIQNLDSYSFLIGLGYKHLEQKSSIINEIKKQNGSLFSLCSSSAFVSQLSTVEDGVVIYPMCNIDKNVILKAGILLNNSVVVSHNCVINESCYLSPGVVLSGNVHVGKNTFIGSGAIVSNGVKIGENCIIGIGSVVTHDIPNGYSVIGNPAKILKHKLNLI